MGKVVISFMELFLLIVEGDGVDDVLVGEEVEFIVIIRNV